MADISDLPKEIVRKIAVEHLENQEDYETFRKVCSTWRSETEDVKYIWPSKNTQLPWLLLADSPTNTFRRCYSLSKHMFRKINLPQFEEDADDHRRYLSSLGWLIAVSRKRAIIHFIDVLSSLIIEPPCFPKSWLEDGEFWDDISYAVQFPKFIFSSRRPPGPTGLISYEVAAVFHTYKRIAFWRPGQEEWMKADSGFDNRQVEDVCFFRGEFYSIDHYTRVIAYGNQTPKQARIVADLKSQGFLPYGERFYIVGLQHSSSTSLLLVIHRETEITDDGSYWAKSFTLYEVSVKDGKARQVDSIGGDRALFVGYNSTFFVQVCPSNEHYCRGNCIYFTEDNVDLHLEPQSMPSDMGIYSLQTNTVVGRFYDGPSQSDLVSPPIWVQLPPY